MKFQKEIKVITLIFSLYIISISCSYKINNNTNGDNKNYEKIYSITLKNKIIGYCGKLKNDYSCKIFLKNGSKKFNYEISMTKNKDFIKYNSPSVKFSKKIKSNYLIYPFLFKNINNNTQIYYPEMDIYLKAKYLSIKSIKNGYIATPFKYIKTNKIPKKIEHLDIIDFREIKSQKIKKIYPSKYVISFNSENLPPSSSRQSCKKLSANKIECEINNQNKIAKNNYYKNEEFSNKNRNPSKELLSFIKKYKLKKENIDDLIPKIIVSLHKEMKYKDISKKMTTSEILKLKQGDCTEFSQVSVDILRTLGIKSKRVYGLIYRAKKGKWIYHSWLEYYNDKYISSFDPVNKLGFINLNYLKLGEENKYGIIIIPLDIENLKFERVN